MNEKSFTRFHGAMRTASSTTPYSLLADGRPRRRCIFFARSTALATIILVVALLSLSQNDALLSLLRRDDALVRASESQTTTCVFVHGAGNSAELDANVGSATSEDRAYWGNLHEVIAPFCGTLSFMHEDTLHVGWEDTGLQQKFCELLREATSGSTDDQGSTQLLLFAHSLGNMLVAGALDSGQCQLPFGSVWFAVGAPWAGSQAADKLPDLCAALQGGLGSPLIASLASRVHFCDGADGAPSAGFASLATGNARLHAVARRWRGRVNASLCGDSPFGLWASEGGGADSYELEALSELVQFGETNDGAVPTASCHSLADGVAPDRSHESLHYTADVNHFDLTCRHGNGWLPWLLPRDARRPCAWYAAMAERALRVGR